MPRPAQKKPVIRRAPTADRAAIATIYNYYVNETVVTFEEEPVSASEMARRMEKAATDSLPWLVAEHKGHIIGYAYALPWKDRSAYRFSVEISVYLHPDHTGRGIGSMLYRPLFFRLRARGIHIVIGGIALPNPASVALHEKFGLEKVAHFREMGFKFDQWIDVGYWQGTL